MNSALNAGTINHLIFLAFVFLGCFLSDFQCTGDDMAVIMMIYVLAIFPYQILAELVILLSLVVSLFDSSWKSTGKVPLCMFITSLILLIQVGF